MSTTGDTATGSKLPKDVTLADLWNLTSSIKADTESLCQRLDSAEERLDDIENEKSIQDEAVKKLQKDVSTMKNNIRIVSGHLQRAEIRNERLQNELSDLKAHSMRSNLIFSFNTISDFSKESAGEDCIAVVQKFLATVMGITDVGSITVAHRLGRKQATCTPDHRHVYIVKRNWENFIEYQKA